MKQKHIIGEFNVNVCETGYVLKSHNNNDKKVTLYENCQQIISPNKFTFLANNKNEGNNTKGLVIEVKNNVIDIKHYKNIIQRGQHLY
jgi:hypothetical protein